MIFFLESITLNLQIKLQQNRTFFLVYLMPLYKIMIYFDVIMVDLYLFLSFV